MTWTAERDRKVITEYPHRPAAAIAREIGKNAHNVRTRAWFLGVTNTGKPRGNYKYPPEFVDSVLADYATMTMQEVADHRGMRLHQVKWIIRKARQKAAQ